MGPFPPSADTPPKGIAPLPERGFVALRLVLEQCHATEVGLRTAQESLQMQHSALRARLLDLQKCLIRPDAAPPAELLALENTVAHMLLCEQRAARWSHVRRFRIPAALSLPVLGACALAAWVGSNAGIEALGSAAASFTAGLAVLIAAQCVSAWRLNSLHQQTEAQRTAALRDLSAGRILPECAQPDAASLMRSTLRWRARIQQGAAETALQDALSALPHLPVLDDQLLGLRALCAAAAQETAPVPQVAAPPVVTTRVASATTLRRNVTVPQFKIASAEA